MRTRMAAMAAAGALLAGFGPAFGDGPVDPLVQRREAKLREAWFTGNNWTVDYDAARARASGEGKLIFAYFTRSYSP
ncbi:MAG: hypothetical protein HY608_11210 [Planctomycetes bacterium]|nr:hypothetical protein [Planctomycetota bacterium]